MERFAALETGELTESFETVLASDETGRAPRRHSFTIVKRRSESENEHETDEEVKPKTRKRSFSLSETPYENSGIPLGSRVAREAAKSFWNMDMYQQSLNKIAMYAANSSSGLGSSLESVDVHAFDSLTAPSVSDDLTEEENHGVVFSPVAPHLKNFPLSLISCSAPTSPTQAHRQSIHRSQSDCSDILTKQPLDNCCRRASRKIAVYSSPLQQLQAELNQSLASTGAHHLSVVDEKVHLVDKVLQTSSHDDGYHGS